MMKKWVALALAALMLMTAGLALADDDTEITVQGTAVVTGTPDMVTVTANASADAASVVDAQDGISRIVESATAKLLDLGVQEQDIVTSSFSCYPVYNYDAETRRLTGYQANHTLQITCRDVEMLDSVIGVITDCGLSEIYDVSYDISTRSELYRQALALAAQAAEEKAVRMAEAAGLQIRSLSSLAENTGYDTGYAVNAAADMAKAESAMGATGIRAGGVSVSARVTAVYEATR